MAISKPLSRTFHRHCTWNYRAHFVWYSVELDNLFNHEKVVQSDTPFLNNQLQKGPWGTRPRGLTSLIICTKYS